MNNQSDRDMLRSIEIVDTGDEAQSHEIVINGVGIGLLFDDDHGCVKSWVMRAYTHTGSESEGTFINRQIALAWALMATDLAKVHHFATAEQRRLEREQRSE